MAFCPICKRTHDPDLSCTDGTTQTLREMGVEEVKKVPKDKEEFNKLNKKVIIYLIIFAFLLSLLVIYMAHFI